jgi:ABC-type microcin C transport system permease subunit YejE
MERRSDKKKLVYLATATISAVLGILAGAMQDDVRGLLPYLAAVVLSLIQFRRPTLFIWIVLTVVSAMPFVLVLALDRNRFAIPQLFAAIPFLIMLAARPQRRHLPQQT